LGDRRERFDHASIDGREHVLDVTTADLLHGPDFVAQLFDDLFEQFWLKDFGCFAERAERRSFTTEFPLDFLQFACLLQCSQRIDRRIEQEQQDQHAILVEVELAIAGLVALAADIAQAIEQRHQFVEVFQARDVLITDVFAFLSGHVLEYARFRPSAQP
jgi:hypothetical protein